MADSFYIGTYWRDRKESLDLVVKKTTFFLQELSKSDEQFQSWYAQGHLEEIEINIESIEMLYKRKIKKNDLDSEGFSRIGFSIGMWTGGKEEHSSSLSINCGHASKFFPNCCLITLPIEGEGKEKLLRLNKQRNIVNLLIKNWNPDNIILSSNKLKSEIGTDEIGWITYYKRINQRPKIRFPLIYEKCEQGHLFYLQNETSYDYTSTKALVPLKTIIR